MKDRNREIALMPEFDSEEAFDAYFAEKTEVVEKVFAGHPEFMHTFFHEGN